MYANNIKNPFTLPMLFFLVLGQEVRVKEKKQLQMEYLYMKSHLLLESVILSG